MKKNITTPAETAKIRCKAEKRLWDETIEKDLALPDTEAQRLLHELQVHQIELEMQNAELLQTREKLEVTLQKYQDLFYFAPIGYLTLNRYGAIQDVNLTGASLLGIEKSNLLGKSFGLFIIEENRSDFSKFLDIVFTNISNKSCEMMLLNNNNVPFFVHIEAKYYEATQECRLALIDIHERKRMEQLNTRLASFPQLNPNPVLEMDSSGRVIYCNPATVNILESLGMAEADASAFIPSDIQDILKSWDRLHEVSIYREVVLKDRRFGETVFLTQHANSVRIYAYDITKRKLVEAALHESEERLRLAQECATVGVWDWMMETGKLHFTPELNKLYGLLPGTINTYQDWRDRVHPDDIVGIETRRDEAIAKHKSFDLEFRGRHSSGEYRWISAKGGAVYGVTGNPVRVFGVNIDIDDRKHVEEALRKNEKKLSDIYASMAEGLVLHEIVYDNFGKAVDYLIIDVNPAFENITGLERSTAIVKKASELYGTGEAPYLERYAEVASTGESTTFEVHFVPMNKHFRISVFSPEKGKFATIFQDITERKQAEEALNQLNDELEERVTKRTEELRQKDQMLILQDRFVVMGEMINNIAHQWRQPLNNLGLAIQKLPFIYDSAEFDKQYLENTSAFAMEQICHMSDTIEVFRNFFKPNKTKVTFDVTQEIRRTLSLIEGNFYDLNIKTSLHTEGDPQVNGYPNEFAQVLLNILTNARDALLENAVVNAMISIKVFSEEKTSVVTITDNAGGINDDIFGRIFDPFFTTKKPDKGTGIGLFMSKTIIEKHMGGRLTVHNSTDGAEFRIEL